MRFRQNDDLIDLSFNVSSDPSISAKVIMYLSEDKKISKKLRICASFFISDDGVVFFGDKAIEVYLDTLKDIFIKDYDYELNCRKFLEDLPVAGNA